MSDCETDYEMPDDSWIEEIEKEEKSYNSFYREINDTIKIYYTYIDSENKIYHIKKDSIELKEGVLNKEKLIFILKKHRNFNNKRHKLISVLQYNVDLAPQELSLYLKKEDNFNFLTIKSSLNDMKWDDTINLFKDLNSLHILFYEAPKSRNKETKKIFINTHRKLKRKSTRKKT